MKMHPATLVEMSDVAGLPKVKMTLPVPLRIGDKILLAFMLRRTHGGRHEVLECSGWFRVTSVALDAAHGPPRQLVSVESAGVTPTWRAVKRLAAPERRLGPTRFPRTTVV